MASKGWHVYYRKSTSSSYIGVSSVLKIPSSFTINSSMEVFPEYFHGFYYGTTLGIDAGFMYFEGGYRLFVFGYEDNFNDSHNIYQGWGQSGTISNVSHGDTVTLKSYLQGSHLHTELDKNGHKIASLNIQLSTKAIDRLKLGATINREITVATNQNTLDGSGVYFNNAVWSEGTMTTTSYSYVPINNSTCPRASSREGIAGGITANNFERSVSTRQVGNYAEDTASAWCDGRSLKKKLKKG